MPLSKKELVDQIATANNLSKAVVAVVIDALCDTVHRELKKDNEIALAGIGKFSVVKRAARTGRNPQTGAALKIAAKKVVRFSAAKALKDSAAGGKAAKATKPAAKAASKTVAKAPAKKASTVKAATKRA